MHSDYRQATCPPGICFKVCVCVCVRTYVLTVCRVPCGAQKRVLAFLEVELKVIVSSQCALGTEFRSSARAGKVLLMAKHLFSLFYLSSSLGSRNLNPVWSSHVAQVCVCGAAFYLVLNFFKQLITQIHLYKNWAKELLSFGHLFSFLLVLRIEPRVSSVLGKWNYLSLILSPTFYCQVNAPTALEILQVLMYTIM